MQPSGNFTDGLKLQSQTTVRRRSWKRNFIDYGEQILTSHGQDTESSKCCSKWMDCIGLSLYTTFIIHWRFNRLLAGPQRGIGQELFTLTIFDMTTAEIKKAVDNGVTVFWNSPAYQVIKDQHGYLIQCNLNGHSIGLTHADGETLNGDPDDFYTSRVKV